MKPIVTIIALLPSLALAQPLPLPKPNGAPAAPCPHGYTSSGSFCVACSWPTGAASVALMAFSPWPRNCCGAPRKASRNTPAVEERILR